MLAQIFIDRYCARIKRPKPVLTADCLRRLRSYHWPGNVRELENVIERAVIIARNGTLSLRNVLPLENVQPIRESKNTGSGRGITTKRDLREVERDTIVHALERAAWKVAGPHGAARTLGIPASTLTSRMKALQIERPKLGDLAPLRITNHTRTRDSREFISS
jgi:transcriptional regulator with GAF, ATPase, and Fis domain